MNKRKSKKQDLLRNRHQDKTIKMKSFECWNLDVTIAKFIVPRLEYFIEHHHGYPCDLTEEEWIIILNKMINSFNIISESRGSLIYETYDSEVQEGLELFAKYFRSLWD